MSDVYNSSYSDKLELVYQAYESVLDLELALSLVSLTQDELTTLKADPDLMARCALCDAKVREDLMLDFRSLAKTAASEGVRLAAIKELGRTLYPKRFKEDPLSVNGSISINIIDDIK